MGFHIRMELKQDNIVSLYKLHNNQNVTSYELSDNESRHYHEFHNGQWHGIAKQISSDDKPVQIFHCQNVKRVEYHGYSNDGKIMCKQIHDGDSYVMTYYYNSGRLKEEQPVLKYGGQNGLDANHGWVRTWFDDEQHQLMSESHRVKGKKSGEYKEWYQSGVIKKKGRYSHNKKEGLWQRWYESGNLKYEREYFDGRLRGIYHTYYDKPGMLLEYEVNYNSNWREGSYKSLYPNALFPKEQG